MGSISSFVRSRFRDDANFSLLWGAHTSSIIGSQISVVAIPLLAISTLHANAFELGILSAATYLPFLLIGLMVGIWVDRSRKRPLLIAADLGRAACLLSVPIAAWTGWLSLPFLLLVIFVHGFLTVIFNVTDISYLPSLVPRDRLVEANSRLQLSTSVAQVGGPAVAGGLVSLISAPFAILTDGVSYLVSAWFLRRITHSEVVPPRAAPEPLRRSLTAGFRALERLPVLRALVLSATMTSFFGAGFQAIMVLFLTKRLDIGPGGVGVIFAAGGCGAIFATLLTGPLARRHGIGPAIVQAQALFGLSGFILPLVFLFPGGAVIIAATAQFFQWGCNVLRAVNGGSLSQMYIPHDEIGRVQATSLVVIKCAELIGSLGAGALALYAGTSTAIIAAEIGMLLSILPLLFSPVLGVRESDIAVAPG